MNSKHVINAHLTEKGSLELKMFILALENGSYEKSTQILTKALKELQGEGLSAGEIKGAFEYAAHICGFGISE